MYIFYTKSEIMAGELYKLYKDVPFQEVFIRIHNTYII